MELERRPRVMRWYLVSKRMVKGGGWEYRQGFLLPSIHFGSSSRWSGRVGEGEQLWESHHGNDGWRRALNIGLSLRQPARLGVLDQNPAG